MKIMHSLLSYLKCLLQIHEYLYGKSMCFFWAEEQSIVLLFVNTKVFFLHSAKKQKQEKKLRNVHFKNLKSWSSSGKSLDFISFNKPVNNFFVFIKRQ